MSKSIDSTLFPGIGNQSGNLPDTVLESIKSMKGRSVTLMDLKGIPSSPALAFIICEGTSSSQVSAIADKIRDDARIKLGIKPYNYDGYRNSQWIVIDYGDLMVHVFQKDTRSLYNLEELWNDAEILNLPDED